MFTEISLCAAATWCERVTSGSITSACTTPRQRNRIILLSGDSITFAAGAVQFFVGPAHQAKDMSPCASWHLECWQAAAAARKFSVALLYMVAEVGGGVFGFWYFDLPSLT
jgi:hypothetical protein